eukprot:TRINITY_DN1223_c0_g1_i1.p1 TRINITY_DN1223_c0_g1~~TRINITY_DN1223_c0_g1_i1.p1  ORF type:complete len:1142 (+),score=352.10 TRINITY_DN1223_c0_g1_i1:95-3520(+)
MIRTLRSAQALLLLLAAGHVSAQTTPQLSTGGFTASWQIVGANANQMLFKVSATTAGTTGPWVSISMDPNGKSHVASDMYVGYMSTAGTGVLDTFSAQQAQPTYDTQQDALSPNVVVDTNGNLNFSFIRNFNTGDTNNDQAITSATTTIGWAFGAGSAQSGANCQYNYHGKTNRGNANFNLVTTAATPAPTAAGTTLAPTPAPTTPAPTTPAPTFGPTPAIAVPAGSFSYVSTNKDFNLVWNVNAATGNITMSMYAPCNGYVGVSFGNVNSLSHSKSDTIVGWVTTTGTVNILDAYSDALIQPVYDNTTQDVTVLSGQNTAQGVMITFTRKLQNNDLTQDYQFLNNGNGTNLGWAYAIAAPSGTGADAAYAQHPKTTRDNAKLDFFTGKAVAVATGQTAANQISTADGSSVVQFQKTTDAATGLPAFTFTLIGPAGANWVGVGFATTRTHQATDFYIAYMGSAGITVVDLFSNDQTTTEQYDASQDAKMIMGQKLANGGITATFTRLADTKDTAGDVVIPNGPIVMSVAAGAQGANAPPAAVTGTTVTYGAHTPASTAARNFFSVNLFTGGVMAVQKPLYPDVELTIIVSVVIGVYALFRFGWKAIKAVKANRNDPVLLQEEPEETYEAPVSAYYYRGSVAVPYRTDASGVMVEENTKNSKVVSPGSRFKKVEEKYGSALLTTKDGLKSNGNSVTNLASRIAHYRIPKSSMSVADLALGLVYLIINLAFVLKPPTQPVIGLVWGYLATANALFVALPATRNSVMVWLLGLPFDKTIMYHRWLGRLVLFQATVHWYYYPMSLRPIYGAKWDYGLVAWICMAIILATSIGWIRRHHFNFFFNSHFAFIAFYITGALHSNLSFVYFAYAATFFYGLDRVIRMFWGAFPSKTVKLEVISGAVRVVFKKHFAAQYKVGQYVFLNFPEIGILEWHPFTLASGPDEQYCEVMIKGLGDHTKKLLAAAEGNRQLWIRVDGPYGKWPYNFARFRGVVLVAGGVGVTPSMALIRHVFHINRETNEVDPYLQDVYFIWSCRNEKEFGWYRDMLEEAMARSALENSKYPRLHGYVHITKPEGGIELPGYIKSGRPNVHEIFDRIEQNGASQEGMRVAVVACGPEVMVSEAWDETSSRTKGSVRFDFHHETFEF